MGKLHLPTRLRTGECLPETRGQRCAFVHPTKTQTGIVTSPGRSNSIEKGVEEIRIRDEAGIYRIIYTARIADTVYILHAFQKKTQATSKQDMDIAKERYKDLMRGTK